MSWCPNCKTEYREGIKTCADCGAPLVAELKEDANVCIAFISESEQAEKFLEFLKYSDITESTMEYDTVEEAFAIFVTKEEENEGKKLFAAFRTSEAAATMTTKEENDTLDTSDEEQDRELLQSDEENQIPLSKLMPESSLTYVKKEDRYNDVKSSAVFFMIFGIVGLIFTGLNIAKIITLLTSWVQFIVLGATSIIFIIIAVRSWIQSKQLYNEIDNENEITAQINNWLAQNITADVLAQFDDSANSPEINFLKKIEYIKTKVLESYEIDSEAYLDQLIEEFYNKTFEQ